MLKTGPDVTGLSRAAARAARIQFWRETFAVSDKSGQTHSDFCRDQSISTGAYFWWKVFRLFSRAERHLLSRGGDVVQVFQTELTPLQREILDLLGVPLRLYAPTS